MDELYINSECQLECWLGYFDILGTKELINSKSIYQVFAIYSKAIEEVKKRSGFMINIQATWFSDTFIIYTRTGSAEDFRDIDSVCRWFVYFLITSRIPVRGAISYGSFYADNKNNLFFGPSLVEAYEYGEAQEWIGFLLCPSSIVQLDEIGLPATERLNYAYYKIPFKKNFCSITNKLPACILGQWIQLNQRNPCVSILLDMVKLIDKDPVRVKYQNTIEFIKKSERRLKKC